MSSGPSARNEKPRPASSQLRRGHAQVEEHALHAAPAQHVVQLREPPAEEREARIGERPRRMLRLRVAIERDQAAVRAEPFEDRPAVATAAEGAVDVGAVGAHRQRLDRLREEHRVMHGRGSQ